MAETEKQRLARLERRRQLQLAAERGEPFGAKPQPKAKSAKKAGA